jgi:hypothetical protein
MNPLPLAQAPPLLQAPPGEPIQEIEDIIVLETVPVDDPSAQLLVRTESLSPWFIPSVIGVSFIISALLLYILTRKKAAAAIASEPPIPPDEQALADLRLVWRQQSEFEDKTFASAISDILREYIEAEFAIRAPELTTEEFLLEARTHDDLRGGFSEQLKAFLNLVDLVKFAKMPLEYKQRDELYQSAVHFVEESHQARLLKISPELSMSAQAKQPKEPTATEG